MRLMALAALAATMAWSANAQDTSGQTDRYYGELAGQCRDKQLQLLSPTDLRDGLDDFVSSLSPDAQTQVRRAEQAQCPGRPSRKSANGSPADPVPEV